MARINCTDFQVKLIDHAPGQAIHEVCGSRCKRHQRRPRTIFDRGCEQQALVVIADVGTYRCLQCECFWTMPVPGTCPRRRYTDRVRAVVANSINDDNMAQRRAHKRLKRDFSLSPSLSSVQRWWLEDAETDDASTISSDAVADFSGLLCIDEVYDSPFALLVATDPISDRQVGYALGKSARSEDVEQFIDRLRASGINPEVVMTDESPLYPNLLKRLWPEARHALCRFHVSRQFTDAALKVVRQIHQEMPRPKKRPPGRPRKRGRKRQDRAKREARKRVWRSRYLLLKRANKLDDAERERLEAALEEDARLCDVRNFIEDWYTLLDDKPRPSTARRRRDAFVRRWGSCGHEPFERMARKLADEVFFGKLCVVLHFNPCETTNNHVERDNRAWRHRQKACFRLRSARSINAARQVMLRKPGRRQPQSLRHRFGCRAGKPVGGAAPALQH